MTRHDDELNFKADAPNSEQTQVVTPTPQQTGDAPVEQDPADITANAVDNSHVDTASERNSE